MKNHSFHPGGPSSLETKTHPVSQRQCDRQNKAPPPCKKDDHVLIHRSCADVTLPGQRDFTGVVEDLAMEDYSGLSSVSAGALTSERRWQQTQSQRRRCEDGSRVWSDERKGTPSQGTWQLEKPRKWILPRSLQEECSPASPFQTSDLCNCKLINLCPVKPPSLR